MSWSGEHSRVPSPTDQSPTFPSWLYMTLLSYTFHIWRRTAPANTAYAAALTDPLLFGFDLDLRGGAWNLMGRDFFIPRPPQRPQRIFWSLRKVLAFLQDPDLFDSQTLPHLLKKALFLVNVASGIWASRLHTLLRHPY